ncbi:MAG: hypothetical protein ISS72_06325 [Candidatus Brocadiae bacterium]|nr:hypothetical protein [Candidatus Brocadiia bacterium]
MRHLSRALALLLLVGSCAAAGTFTFGNGPLRLTFDDGSGALLGIALQGAPLAKVPPGRSPSTFGVGPKGKVKWLEQLGHPRQVVKRTQPSDHVLELTIRIGDYELIERYTLDAALPRLDRSAALTYRGKDTPKLRGLAFKTTGIIAPGDGFYRFPGKWPPTSHPFAEMKPGTQRHGRGSISPLLVQIAPKRCLLFASMATDTPSVQVTEDKGQLEVAQGIQAAGYLRPNEPQHIGSVTMQVVEASYWDALPRLWDWMDSVGLKVPADRPEWVQDAILYEFHPGGTIGSNWTDLGGFKAAAEKLLPVVRDLGCTAIWIQPIEYRSPYWPLDYYRFMDGLGTADEYRALVKAAHDMGFKVIQDIVPHGGAPQAVHNQKHPEFMLRREDGTTLSYWLNDFARPDWQDTIGKVAAHYVREYGVDGYRIDACYGSKELNWDPKIPYARASHAKLKGGLEMVQRIRDETRKLKPKDGAVLAEVESARHAAVSDFQYDFGLCYHVLHQWRKMPAAEFVPLLQDYLEEQKYTYPRGTLFLRHIESHDSLHSQGWYGGGGMRALYALTAWIRGVPLLYLDQEIGHSFALREINRIRRKLPELSRGEAFYRAVKCDQPTVFTCLRKLGDEQSIVAINLGRETVKTELAWPGGSAARELLPLEHTVVPHMPLSGPGAIRRIGRSDWVASEVNDPGAFPGATHWFVDTIEGRLADTFRVRRCAAPPQKGSSIYWRPQGTNVLWAHDTLPLHPSVQRVLASSLDRLAITEFKGRPPVGLRLVERRSNKEGLFLTGYEGANLIHWQGTSFPAFVITPVQAYGAMLRVVGPDYIVTNRHYTLVLRRQGGVIRELIAGDRVLVNDHDLYGDQAYFALHRDRRIAASNDVENGIRIWTDKDGLHLAFEGQLRGFNRFSLKRPPLWFRNEYVFSDKPSFQQRWAFRTEKTFKDQMAFLSAICMVPDATHFRFLRDGKLIADAAMGDPSQRHGETKGTPPPTRIEFLAGDRLAWALALRKVPAGYAGNVFVHGRQFFITLLDGRASAMAQGRWYEFEAEWQPVPK